MGVIDIKLAYDGAAYHGFARQLEQTGSAQIDKVPTVQGEIERALALVYRREVPTVCAGRTDAGVHARAQHISFDLDEDELKAMPLEVLVRHLNGILPEDIAVCSARLAPEGFSARFSAKARSYRYLISDSSTPPVSLAKRAWWVKKRLDLDVMADAANLVLGEHDFKAFCKAEAAIDANTVRELYSISLERTVELGEPCIAVSVCGNAFLHNMVRIIVGSLVDVGLGKRPASWIAEVLLSKDRKEAGQTAPAKGLAFWEVSYG